MGVYLHSEEPKPHFLRSGQNSCTRLPLVDTKFSFQKVPISFANIRVSHSEFIVVFPENTLSYVTTTAFLTLPIYNKPENAEGIEENILVFFLMCELNITVKFYSMACSLMLTHISSRIRTIRFRAFCLISVPLYNNKNVPMLVY